MAKKEKKPGSLDKIFEGVAKLQPAHKIAILIGTIVLLVGPVGYFKFYPDYQKIEELKKELGDLKKDLRIAQQKASKYKDFQAEEKKAEAQFNEAKKALPENDEIPELLIDISRSGQDAGLEFLLFSQKPDEPADFFAGIPVAMQVHGGYHEVAVFFEKLARLPRIVTVRELSMENMKESDKLETTLTAYTYKFLEPESKPKPKPKPKGDKKPPRKSSGHGGH